MVEQSNLIIYLHPEAMSSPSWALIDESGVLTQCVYQGQIQDLNLLANAKHITVIVPGEEVYLTSVVLPKMSNSRLKQAIPFAIEDQLATDLETSHIAISTYHDQQTTFLAITSKTTIESWLHLLKSWNIFPHTFIPSQLAIPFEEHKWHINILSNAQVRTGLISGFACEEAMLSAWLEKALISTMQTTPELIITSLKPCLISDNLKNKYKITQHILTPIESIQYIAQTTLQDKAPINLLQDAYATHLPKDHENKYWWQLSKYLATLLCIALFIYPTISYILLKQAIYHNQQAINSIYHHYFPHDSTAISAKMRMEQKIQQLNEMGIENQFLNLLSQFAKAFQTTKGIELIRIDYQTKQLNIQLTATHSQNLDVLIQALSKQNLTVKQVNASISGEQVKTRLMIS